MDDYYGTETWCYAMAKELSKKYNVTVYSRGLGKMAYRINEFCKITDKIKEKYDLGIINHQDCWAVRADTKIFTSHSKFYPIEQPPKKAEHVVGVTEYINENVIRNGVDCERFKPTKVNKKLENILYLSNPAYAGAKDFLKQACEGYNLITVEEQIFNIEDLIKESDLVISLGRGALESMACGKNVIYGDFRKGWMNEFRAGGLVRPETYKDFKTGEWQRDRKPMTVNELRAELAKYDPKIGEWSRKMILKDFNIKKTAHEYIKLWTNIKKGI